MNCIHRFLRAAWHALLLALAVLYAVACSTETTRVVLTDKSGAVSDTTTTVRRADPFALKLVDTVAEIYRPTRAIIVREEKSDPEIRRLLQGWRGPRAVALTGPITPEEIANRRPSK